MAQKSSLVFLLLAAFSLTFSNFTARAAEDPAIEQPAPLEDAQAAKRRELEEQFRFLSNRLNNLPAPPDVRGEAISLAGQPAAAEQDERPEDR